MTTKKVLWILQLSALRHAAAFFGCDQEWYVAGTAIPPDVPDVEVQLYQAVQAKVRGISPAYVPRGTGARFVIVLTAALAFNEHMKVRCMLQENTTQPLHQVEARKLSNDAFECSVRSLSRPHNLTLVATWPDSTELRLPAGSVGVYDALQLQPDTGPSDVWTRVTILGLGFSHCTQEGVPCYCFTTVEGGTAIQKAHGLNDTHLLCAVPPRPGNASGWAVALRVAVGQRDVRTPVPLQFLYHGESPHPHLTGVVLALACFALTAAVALVWVCKGLLTASDPGEAAGLWPDRPCPSPEVRTEPVPIARPSFTHWADS
eukprot:EG_transcript_17034